MRSAEERAEDRRLDEYLATHRQCPYEESHWILTERISMHVKYAKQHPGIRFEPCKCQKYIRQEEYRRLGAVRSLFRLWATHIKNSEKSFR